MVTRLILFVQTSTHYTDAGTIMGTVHYIIENKIYYTIELTAVTFLNLLNCYESY